MKYQFKGNLRGFYCGDCFDFLYNANVKIYAVDKAANVTAMAVAREKETFHQRSEEELKGLSKRLIGEAVTDNTGNFMVDLSEKNYDGGAFEIDFECGNVPLTIPPKKLEPPRSPKPLQFHVTTFLPQWQQDKQESRQLLTVYWEYAINSTFWCRILRLFKLYVVCGLVEVCEKKVPLANVKVKAFDVDLLQDDFLGEAITDASGHFKIYYTEADFSKTIFSWLNVEWPAGPDLFFRVEQLNGTILLQEPRSKGHTPGRENVANCTCVKLCVDGNVEPPQPVPVPAFLRIGGIDYETGMMSHVGQSGLTNSNYAFFSSLRLNGILAQTYNNVAMEYCFEYTNQYNGSGQPINWNRVLADKMGQCNIGYVEKATLMPADASHPFAWYHYDYQYCVVNSGSSPGIIGIPVNAEGWIAVPQQNDNPLNSSGSGMFVANGNQIIVNSAMLESFPSIDLTGLIAGASSTSTGKPLGNDKVVALRMLVRQLNNDATIAEAGRCTRAAINNTVYDGMNHHPEWGPKPITSEAGVCMVDIEQLRAAGCAKITTQVDVLYTCAHPNLGAVSATLTGPGGTIGLPIAAPGNPKDNFGTITHLFTPADPMCAYVVTLSTVYLLTTGDGNMNAVHDQIAFCR